MFRLPSTFPTLMVLPTQKLRETGRTIPSTSTVSVFGMSLLVRTMGYFEILNLFFRSVPALVISPWVKKGAIEHDGINGEGLTYTHSSLAAFISKVRLILEDNSLKMR